MSVSYSQAEILLFAVLTLEKQLEAGLIDKEHMPSMRIVDCDTNEMCALQKKIDDTKVIPHPIDLARSTEGLYESNKEFMKMFNILLARSKEEGTIPKSGRIH